jgi:predicted dehydrogenase
MINVGIVGSVSAIRKHTSALNKIGGVRIINHWISGGMLDSATDSETGRVYTEPGPLLEKTDALIITEAGAFCSRMAVAALRKARHVFLYPTVVHSFTEVYHLIQLAREANVILKCGRTGTTGIQALIKVLPDTHDISMIDFQHYRKITRPGSTGISEALLSDVEIINNLVHARVISIKAKGLCMLSSQPEILNARFEFDNGCAVNYNCNLVAAQNEFLITIVVRNKILKYNFLTGALTGWYLQRTINQNECPIFIESIQVEQTDSLWNDLSDYFTMILSGPAFLSINDNGFESYVLTDRILDKVMKTLIQCA